MSKSKQSIRLLIKAPSHTLNDQSLLQCMVCVTVSVYNIECSRIHWLCGGRLREWWWTCEGWYLMILTLRCICARQRSNMSWRGFATQRSKQLQKLGLHIFAHEPRYMAHIIPMLDPSLDSVHILLLHFMITVPYLTLYTQSVCRSRSKLLPLPITHDIVISVMNSKQFHPDSI